uniref:Uncharacterized protein n=1 Tax=Anguilla anguilla TaxID=7936 RepID=A0A0E9SPV9_ANGAN
MLRICDKKLHGYDTELIPLRFIIIYFLQI